MFAVCLRYSNSYEDAQDTFQEAFVKAFKKIEKYNHKGSFEGWLRRLMVNQCMDKFREKRMLIVKEHVYENHTETAEEIIEPLYTKKELLKAIQKLPDQYQLVFNLYVIEEYSHAEIAEKLNISVGTSKSNLSRAKQWLRDELKKNIEPNNQVMNG